MVEDDVFVKEILEEYGPIQPFEPCAYYDRDGDCLEFLFSNEPYRGKRLDHWVTVYYDRETDDIVGGLVKDINRLMQDYPGLDIEIAERRVKVALILRAPAWKEKDAIVKKTYRDVIRRAEDANLYAEYELTEA